jgi:Txe/YoeB family toxin of toxin-antitoxin system
MYKFVESRNALNDWKKIKSMSKQVKDRYKLLISDILINPRSFNSIGNPEQLKYKSSEMYSRELTKKDRIVYSIESGE